MLESLAEPVWNPWPQFSGCPNVRVNPAIVSSKNRSCSIPDTVKVIVDVSTGTSTKKLIPIGVTPTPRSWLL